MIPTLKKTKFKRKATEDYESSFESTEEMAKEMDLGTILIGTISISLNCFTISLTMPNLFKSKKTEESLVEVKKVQSIIDSQRVITIDSSKGNMA